MTDVLLHFLDASWPSVRVEQWGRGNVRGTSGVIPLPITATVLVVLSTDVIGTDIDTISTDFVESWVLPATTESGFKLASTQPISFVGWIAVCLKSQ